ncbi:MAG: hypothetical protein KGZ67_08885, partial [Hydrogenophaga sp.]|nr:hypothetical protein [Hydrogenophaga sp.]
MDQDRPHESANLFFAQQSYHFGSQAIPDQLVNLFVFYPGFFKRQFFGLLPGHKGFSVQVISTLQR